MAAPAAPVFPVAAPGLLPGPVPTAPPAVTPFVPSRPSGAAAGATPIVGPAPLAGFGPAAVGAAYVPVPAAARPGSGSGSTYMGQVPGFRVPGCRFGVVDVSSRRCAPVPPPRPEPEPEPEPEEEERDCGWKPCFVSDVVDSVGDAAGAVGEFVDEHKVEILTEVALTAVSFVPVAGPVVRVGMLVHRGVSASRVARAVAPVTSRVGSVASRVGSAGRACRANSFDGATLVLMADGSGKPISEVEVGDLVLATDPETGRTEAREVTDLIVGEGVKSMVAVTVDAPGPDGVLMATALHPFWDAADREWVDATDLAAGDLLLAPDGELLPVEGTRRVRTCPDGLQPHRRRHPHVLCPRRTRTRPRPQLR